MNKESARAFVERIRAGAVAFAAPSPARQLPAFRERVQAILTQELRIADVTWTPQRDLQFVIEEFEYRFHFDADDPLFVTVSAGFFAGFTDDALRARALVSAAEVNRIAKVAKLFVAYREPRWMVGAAVEVVLPAFDMVDRAFVKRLIGLLRNGMREFQRQWDRGSE
jgi:hypothetical protein